MQIENLLSSKAAMLGLAVLAFLAAAILVLVIVRMLFGGKLRMPGGRARQARLGIVDAFDLDRQRQLIIVRRDNTEHLIMIGGPNDLLIESEIVRVEARDFRRDKAPEGSFGDARIPAPFTPPERPEKTAGQAPPADEPMLPIPLPEVATVAAPPTESATTEPATPPRGPTFPLPPRRPAPASERRPPVPPRLPEVALRDEGAPPVAAPAPTVAPPSRAPAPSPLPGASAVPPASPTPSVAPPPPLAPPSPAARPVPPFIKPLSPRPPLRPLQRTTPRPLTPPGAPPADPAAKPAAEPAPKSAVSTQAPAAEAPPDTPFTPPQPPLQDPPPAASTPSAQTPAAPAAEPAAPEDDLSLEEEMAKLLGRG